MRAPEVTPLRIKWLAHLAKHGEMPWDRMPRSDKACHRLTRTKAAGSNRTWRPMEEAGWILARYGQRTARELPDWLFTITDAGRAVLEQAQKTDER